MNADMATKAQLVPEAKTMPPMRKPTTFNELERIVYQYLAKHTQGCHMSSWRAMVSVCDRIPLAMNLITNHLLAMDEGDPVKVAEWSCNFELHTFHKSVSKEIWREEMQQKIGEFCNQRKGNEPRNDVLRDKYGLPFIYPFPQPKRPEDMKGIWPPRRKRVWRCQEVECALSLITYTEKGLQQHINTEHTKPRESPLESAQQDLSLAVGAELYGGELTTGAATNLVMPSPNASGPSVPYTVAQNGANVDIGHRSGLSTNLVKRKQPQQITSRGVRDERISRPSATSKRPLREIRAKSSSKES
ncbi:gall11 coactivator [Fusarium pseudoanthophilum]|uniref:Gall11 coactivator n=1 Tax=Fusarium pseudoanthophilum TaxID=48495 RepID=A0A8H5KHJ2_9HYPO|nr:gall11 coactivator [Fusarium pseudoanthophilum]